MVFLLQGVIIREIDDGVRCEQCKSNCPGFAAHDWRYLRSFTLS